MAWLQPPVYSNGQLVAPWHLRFTATIPAHLVSGTPASARWRLVVEDSVVDEDTAEPQLGDNGYVVSVAKDYASIEWPQTVKVPVTESAQENVTRYVVDSGPFYTAVYAASSAPRVCIATVCEDTDRDGDGLVEVVYLARPSERVEVRCDEPCTVRLWRAPVLSKLSARIELELLDDNGSQLGSWQFPVETVEAPDFVPSGFTITMPAAAAGLQYPWCGASLEPYRIPADIVEPAPSTYGFKARAWNIRVNDWAKFTALYALDGINGRVAGGVAAYTFDRYYNTASLGCFTGGTCKTYGVCLLEPDAQSCSAQVPDEFVLIEYDVTLLNYAYSVGPSRTQDVFIALFGNGMVAPLHWHSFWSDLEYTLVERGAVQLEKFYMFERQFLQLRPGSSYSVTLKPGEALIVDFMPRSTRILVRGEDIVGKAQYVGDKSPVASRLIVLNMGDRVYALWFYAPVAAVAEDRQWIDAVTVVSAGKGAAYYTAAHDYSDVVVEMDVSDEDVASDPSGFIAAEHLYLAA